MIISFNQYNDRVNLLRIIYRVVAVHCNKNYKNTKILNKGIDKKFINCILNVSLQYDTN